MKLAVPILKLFARRPSIPLALLLLAVAGYNVYLSQALAFAREEAKWVEAENLNLHETIAKGEWQYAISTEACEGYISRLLHAGSSQRSAADSVLELVGDTDDEDADDSDSHVSTSDPRHQ